MSEQATGSASAVLKQSIVTIQNLRGQLAKARGAAREPIAVVGLAVLPILLAMPETRRARAMDGAPARQP